jgi:hypothetical protein
VLGTLISDREVFEHECIQVLTDCVLMLTGAHRQGRDGAWAIAEKFENLAARFGEVPHVIA